MEPTYPTTEQLHLISDLKVRNFTKPSIQKVRNILN